MDDFEGDELVVRGSGAGDEEKRSITTIDYFAIWNGETMSAWFKERSMHMAAL